MMKYIMELIILFITPFFTYSYQHILIKLRSKFLIPIIFKLCHINSIMYGVTILVVTNHSEYSFISKDGNLFIGICGKLLLLLFQSNYIHFLILPWNSYGILVRYWVSHIINLLVGLQNFSLQLWVFSGNFSDNYVIYKLIRGSFIVSLPPTYLEIFFIFQNIYWSRVILRIIIFNQECLDVYRFPTFYKLCIGSAAPIQMVYY